LQIARAQKDRQTEAAVLGSLGNAYLLMGEYNQAIAYLQASLKVANEINNPGYRSSTLNSLGNAISLAKVNYRRANSADQRGDSTEANRFREQAFSYDSKALKHFQNSLNLALRTTDRVKFAYSSIRLSLSPHQSINFS